MKIQYTYYFNKTSITTYSPEYTDYQSYIKQEANYQNIQNYIFMKILLMIQDPRILVGSIVGDKLPNSAKIFKYGIAVNHHY